MDNCRAELDGISKDDYLKSYSSDDLIFKEPTYNLKYARSWIDQVGVTINCLLNVTF